MIIHDTETGLTWDADEKQGAGYTWDTASALARENNIAKVCGYDDWRLPTSKELKEAGKRLTGFMQGGPVWTCEHYHYTGSDVYWTVNPITGERISHSSAKHLFAFFVRGPAAISVFEKTKQERIDSQVSFPTVEELRTWLEAGKQ